MSDGADGPSRGGTALPGIVRAGILAYVPVALLSFAWICLRQDVPRAFDTLIGGAVVRDAVLGIGVGLMLVGITRLASACVPHVRRAEAALAEMLGPLTTGACLLLAVLSGVAEELLFRGAMQPALGLVATSLIFGAVHVPMRRELLAWPVVAAAAGALLGWMANETGALLAPILAHITVNAVNLRFIAPRAQATPLLESPRP